VLYLHGHIHDDPVEIVEQCYPSPGKVLSVSAPLFSSGFNLLTLEFGKLGRPLGSIITRYRYERGGDVRPQPQIRVSLREPSDVPDALVAQIIDQMNAGSRYRFEDLRKTFDASAASPVPETEFCDALLEAEWAGLVQIVQRSDEPSHWQIARELL
jgi:hypothetical protein